MLFCRECRKIQNSTEKVASGILALFLANATKHSHSKRYRSRALTCFILPSAVLRRPAVFGFARQQIRRSHLGFGTKATAGRSSPFCEQSLYWTFAGIARLFCRTNQVAFRRKKVNGACYNQRKQSQHSSINSNRQNGFANH